jgi:hypothetical protein
VQHFFGNIDSDHLLVRVILQDKAFKLPGTAGDIQDPVGRTKRDRRF